MLLRRLDILVTYVPYAFSDGTPSREPGILDILGDKAARALR